MKTYIETQVINQLEKRKGGYNYLKLDATIINQFSKKKSTRLVCQLDGRISFRCGLNHFGDGNFYIIVAGKHLKELNKKVGEKVNLRIDEDPDQLGVDIPEVLTVFLEQDQEAKKIFDNLTDGKKRSIIYRIIKLKNIDKQIKIITTLLALEN